MPYKALASDGKDGRKRKGKRTVKNSATAPRKILITARFKAMAEEACQYRLMNYPLRQIADEMKVDVAYVQRLIKWSLEREPVEGAGDLRRKMTDQLNQMIVSKLDLAFEGDDAAQDQVRRNMEMIAKLNGAYAPAKVEHSGEVEGGGTTVFVITPEDADL